MIVLKNDIAIKGSNIATTAKLYKRAREEDIKIPEGCVFSDRKDYDAVLKMKKLNFGEAESGEIFYQIVLSIDELNVEKVLFNGSLKKYDFKKACGIYGGILEKIQGGKYKLNVVLEAVDVKLALE